MLDKAIDKIRDEMAAKSADTYVQCVGEYLTSYLQGHPGAAEKILDKDKTIAGSLKKMEDYARKHKSGNCGVVPPDVGFNIVLKYFGLKPDGEAEPVKPASACGFDIGLDSLLEG